MKSEVDYRQDIIRVGRMLHSHGYIAATDGNISIRVSPDRILTTASGVSKGFLRDEHIVAVDADGNVLLGRHKPSSELKMHLITYKLRPEVKAIVHAHPPTCTAFTIAGISLAKCILPEVVMTLGVIPTADYATPTTGEVPDSIKDHIMKYDAVILDRHGAITVSKSDVYDAYYKLEKIEHTAEITLRARQLGKVKTLTGEQIEKLADVSGIAKEKLCTSTCVNCGACGKHNVLSNKGGGLVGKGSSPDQNVPAQSGGALSPHNAPGNREGTFVSKESSSDQNVSTQSGEASPDSLEALVREEVMAEVKKIFS
jgi:L-fuculose-phosphate aldolase